MSLANFNIQILTYRQVRLQWCRSRLVAFCRKWAIYIAALLFMCAAGSNSFVTTFLAVLSATAYPFIWAGDLEIPARCAIVIAYGVTGLGLCWAMRPILWPTHWRDAEWAFPIKPSEKTLVDLQVISFCLLPYYGVLAVGLAIWMLQTAVPFSSRLQALFEISVAAALSVGSALVLVSVLRKAGRNSTWTIGIRSRAASALKLPGKLRTIPVWRALIFLPLWRQAGRRGYWLTLASLGLPGIPLILMRTPAATPWGLAILATLLFALTSRLNAVLASDIAPLHAGCAGLPIAPGRLLRMRRMVGLAPAIAGTGSVLLMLFCAEGSLRAQVVLWYLVVVLASNAWQVACASSQHQWYQEMNPFNRAAAWVILLVLQIAMASETLTHA
jgi:hypothetical protein